MFAPHGHGELPWKRAVGGTYTDEGGRANEHAVFTFMTPMPNTLHPTHWLTDA